MRTIGVMEISKTTHITVSSLEQIINKDFDNLDKTKTIGFLNIISDIYDIDFAEYAQEFRKAKEDNEEYDDKTKVTIKQKDYTTLIVAAGSFLLVCAIYFVFVADDEIEDSVDSENRDYIANIKSNIKKSREITQIVQNNRVSKQNFDVNTTEENLTKNSFIIEPNRVNEKEIEEPNEEIKSSNQIEEEAKIDETPKSVEDSQNKIASSSKVSIPDIKLATGAFSIDIKDGALYIKPNSTLWIGIIYLNQGKKVDDTLSAIKRYTLEENTIIATGHSYMDFKLDGITYKFRGSKKLYFYVKNSKLIEISKSQYFKLSGGFRW
jgi:hypothetical protein